VSVNDEVSCLRAELETERRERRRLEGLLATEREVLTGLADGRPEDEILLALIRFIEDQVPALRASIVHLEGDRIRSGLAPSMDPAYLAAIDGLPIGPEEGSCGSAAYHGKVVLVADVATHPLWEKYRALGESNGFRACWSLPMKSPEGEVMGTLAVYRAEPGLPDEFTLGLLERSAALAGLSLQRSRTLKTLRETSERLSIIHEASPVGILLSEVRTGRLLEVNEAWAQIVGWTREELLGRTSLELGIWADPQERIPISQELLETGTVRGRPVRIRRKDGTFRLVRTHVHRVDVVGVPCAVSIQRDITEVAEQEERLRRTERLATVGTLVGGVAHELNNPLAAVQGFCQLLLDAQDDVDLRETLELIQREAGRMTRIVDDLRVLARGASSGETGTEEWVDAHEVIRHVVRLREYTFRTSNIRIRTGLGPASLPVTMEPSSLEQVLLNLVTNAEHALRTVEEGPRHLELSTGVKDGRGMIRVADSGPGIPEPLVSRVFDPFFTTKEPGEGMGLGLSLVQKLVTEAGGEVHLRNEPGKGLEVEISLPLITEKASEDPSSTPPTSPSRDGPLRVLVVDDEEPIRKLLERLLSRKGHEVVTAVDGREALECLDAASSGRPFDRILSDLRMPGLSGPEFLRELRRRGRGEAGRLLFMTGDHASPEAARVLEGSGVPWIVKPFALQEVLKVIVRGGNGETASESGE